MQRDQLPRLLSTEDVSEYLEIPVCILDRWRSTSYGPPFIKLGRNLRSPDGALPGWINSNTFTPEPE